MASQLFVEKGLVRRQQVRNARVLFQLSVEKQLRLGDERGTQVVIEPWKLCAVRIQQPNIASLEPVGEEILDQRIARARIGEHARDLLFENRRLMQFPLDPEVEQRVVRNAAPQKERNREASSTSETRYAAPGAVPAGSASMRNRKSGLTSTRSSAARMPSSKVPAVRARL